MSDDCERKINAVQIAVQESCDRKFSLCGMTYVKKGTADV